MAEDQVLNVKVKLTGDVKGDASRMGREAHDSFQQGFNQGDIGPDQGKWTTAGKTGGQHMAAGVKEGFKPDLAAGAQQSVASLAGTIRSAMGGLASGGLLGFFNSFSHRVDEAGGKARKFGTEAAEAGERGARGVSKLGEAFKLGAEALAAGNFQAGVAAVRGLGEAGEEGASGVGALGAAVARSIPQIAALVSAVAAVTAAVQVVADEGVKLDETYQNLAATVGVSVKQFIAFSEAMRSQGINADQMGRAFAQLAQHIRASQEAIRENIEDAPLNAADAAQAIVDADRKVIDSKRELADAVEQAAVAMEKASEEARFAAQDDALAADEMERLRPASAALSVASAANRVAMDQARHISDPAQRAQRMAELKRQSDRIREATDVESLEQAKHELEVAQEGAEKSEFRQGQGMAPGGGPGAQMRVEESARRADAAVEQIAKAVDAIAAAQRGVIRAEYGGERQQFKNIPDVLGMLRGGDIAGFMRASPEIQSEALIHLGDVQYGGGAMGTLRALSEVVRAYGVAQEPGGPAGQMVQQLMRSIGLDPRRLGTDPAHFMRALSNLGPGGIQGDVNDPNVQLLNRSLQEIEKGEPRYYQTRAEMQGQGERTLAQLGGMAMSSAVANFQTAASGLAKISDIFEKIQKQGVISTALDEVGQAAHAAAEGLADLVRSLGGNPVDVGKPHWPNAPAEGPTIHIPIPGLSELNPIGTAHAAEGEGPRARITIEAPLPLPVAISDSLGKPVGVSAGAAPTAPVGAGAVPTTSAAPAGAGAAPAAPAGAGAAPAVPAGAGAAPAVPTGAGAASTVPAAADAAAAPAAAAAASEAVPEAPGAPAGGEAASAGPPSAEAMQQSREALSGGGGFNIVLPGAPAGGGSGGPIDVGGGGAAIVPSLPTPGQIGRFNAMNMAIADPRHVRVGPGAGLEGEPGHLDTNLKAGTPRYAELLDLWQNSPEGRPGVDPGLSRLRNWALDPNNVVPVQGNRPTVYEPPPMPDVRTHGFQIRVEHGDPGFRARVTTGDIGKIGYDQIHGGYYVIGDVDHVYDTARHAQEAQKAWRAGRAPPSAGLVSSKEYNTSLGGVDPNAPRRPPQSFATFTSYGTRRPDLLLHNLSGLLSGDISGGDATAGGPAQRSLRDISGGAIPGGEGPGGAARATRPRGETRTGVGGPGAVATGRVELSTAKESFERDQKIEIRARLLAQRAGRPLDWSRFGNEAAKQVDEEDRTAAYLKDQLKSMAIPETSVNLSAPGDYPPIGQQYDWNIGARPMLPGEGTIGDRSTMAPEHSWERLKRRLRGEESWAAGGLISGPGTGTSDSIPAMLSTGEYVLRASAVRGLGTSFLDTINSNGFAGGGVIPGFAAGGDLQSRLQAGFDRLTGDDPSTFNPPPATNDPTMAKVYGLLQQQGAHWVARASRWRWRGGYYVQDSYITNLYHQLQAQQIDSGYAAGGLVPAMVSNGEYLVNGGAVAHYGVGFFDKLNQLAGGGQAMHLTTLPGPATGEGIPGPEDIAPSTVSSAIAYRNAALPQYTGLESRIGDPGKFTGDFGSFNDLVEGMSRSLAPLLENVGSSAIADSGSLDSGHQLDLRTDAGDFTASVHADTLAAISQSSLGTQLSSTGTRPGWWS